MKKSMITSAAITLAAITLYAVFAADKAPAGTMGGGMVGGYTRSNPGTAWEVPPAQAVRSNPVPADSESIDAGYALFERFCSYCHGPDGQGTGLAPDLTGTSVRRQLDGALFYKISRGKSPMPGFADVLTPRQRWAIVNFIRALASEPDWEDEPTAVPQTGDARAMGSALRRAQLMAMLDSMDMLMSTGSAATAPDGTIYVMMGNQLLKYDENLNLIKQTEVQLDWESWQKTMTAASQAQTN